MINTISVGKEIEIIRPVECGYIRYALFDFDGTISLIREGWQGVMIPMMAEILMQCTTHETHEELETIVEGYVTHLTGRQTIYQMIQLCKEIRKRGGIPKDPREYKYIYLDLLSTRIQDRIRGLEEKKHAPEDFMVSGSMEMIQYMLDRQIVCFLASGTDEKFVLEEARLLGIDRYFQGIYGALDNYENFSKKMVIDRIIDQYHLGGKEFVSFGDGYVEIEDAKSVGGIAVGIASDEATRMGVNAWKRKRLIEAGADIIAPDFREYQQLAEYLLTKTQGT